MLKEDQHTSGDRSGHRSTTEKQTAVNQPVSQQSEEIHIRNFDLNKAHNLTIEVHDSDGLVFANRYYLTPGKTESELGRLQPGEYELRVELDGRRQETTTCAVDGTPERTALVEVGNGTISVTEGHYQ
jgi:hypothetical protein